MRPTPRRATCGERGRRLMWASCERATDCRLSARAPTSPARTSVACRSAPHSRSHPPHRWPRPPARPHHTITPSHQLGPGQPGAHLHRLRHRHRPHLPRAQGKLRRASLQAILVHDSSLSLYRQAAPGASLTLLCIVSLYDCITPWPGLAAGQAERPGGARSFLIRVSSLVLSLSRHVIHQGKLNGLAVRVPLTNASITDCVFDVARPTTEAEVNGLLKARLGQWFPLFT
jgi:hypothetical protein